MISYNLDRFGEEYVKELINQLIKLDKVASGELINSLDYEVIEELDRATVRILSPNYLQYIDQGRPPGIMPPVSAIERWTIDKGIQPQGGQTRNQLAWAIAKGIEKNGIQATNVFDKVEEVLYNRIQLIITLGLDQNIEVILST